MFALVFFRLDSKKKFLELKKLTEVDREDFGEKPDKDTSSSSSLLLLVICLELKVESFPKRSHSCGNLRVGDVPSDPPVSV